MKFESKYEVGQRVFNRCLYTNEKMEVCKVVAETSKNETKLKYYCRGVYNRELYLWIDEEDIVPERQGPEMIFNLIKFDRYYVLQEDGECICRVFNDDKFDENRIYQGNAFMSQEEAEFESKRRRIHQELKELSNGYKFINGMLNHYIVYYYSTDYVETEATFNSYCPGIVYFSTEEEADKAIEIIGEERLISDYFGIKEEEDER